MGIEPSEWIGLADDCASFMFLKHNEILSLPYEDRFHQGFSERKYRSLHSCGTTNHLLEKMVKLNLKSFELGEMVDIPKV